MDSESLLTLGAEGTISNISITNDGISFTLTLTNCTISASGTKDKEYVQGECSSFLECNEGLIFGAGLDVFETEPPEPNNPLLKNDKVFLSPHTAAFTEECMTRMGKETVQNIIDFFDEKLEKSKIVKL